MDIFSHWLRKLNADMQKAQRKILLLMDNATPHIFEKSASFSNITLYYLPQTQQLTYNFATWVLYIHLK